MYGRDPTHTFPMSLTFVNHVYTIQNFVDLMGSLGENYLFVLGSKNQAFGVCLISTCVSANTQIFLGELGGLKSHS